MRISYEVRFKVAPSLRGPGVERKIVHEVEDTKNEASNMSAALVGASMVLDKEGIDRWSLVTISKVTS